VPRQIVFYVRRLVARYVEDISSLSGRLYLRLEDEFELSERAEILDRKVELISRTVSTTLDLLQTQRGLRVEWYIVALIVFEILLSIYDLFIRSR
jgi:required for meiotic nuclear division protein 1